MKRIVVTRCGGPEVLTIEEADAPRPGPGEVCVRVLAAGVSFTDALLRAGTYFHCPKPPFTPGYELVGVVEDVGSGCSRLKKGDRIGALTVWGAYAERVCVPEDGAVELSEDLDPAEVVCLLFPYMTAYQLLHRTANAKPGETVLVHGAAGRVGIAAVELGVAAGLRVIGTASERDLPTVKRRGAIAIDYRNEDFVKRVREITGDGVDIALDGLGGMLSLRSFRALRQGGRLVIFGHYSTLSGGRKSWQGWMEWYAATGLVALWAGVSPRRRVFAYRIQKMREEKLVHSGTAGGEPQDPAWYREDFGALLELYRRGEIRPVVAARLPLAEARQAHEMLARTAAVGKIVLVPSPL